MDFLLNNFLQFSMINSKKKSFYEKNLSAQQKKKKE